MSERFEKILFFGITFFGVLIFLFCLNRHNKSVLSKLRDVSVTYEDSLYLEISSIVYDQHVKVSIINDSLRLCSEYDIIPTKVSTAESFDNNYFNFRILSKKANCDTLITIDRNGQLRLYNVRSGPCYDAKTGKYNWHK